MNTVLNQLRRAILLDPHDPVARLAYADALEETDDRLIVYAEFIRLQCVLADRDDCYCLDERQWAKVHRNSHEPLVRQAAERLREMYGNEQIVAILGKKPFTANRIWNRGFVEKIELSLVDFRQHVGHLFYHHPIQEVYIYDAIQQWPIDVGSWRVIPYNLEIAEDPEVSIWHEMTQQNPTLKSDHPFVPNPTQLFRKRGDAVRAVSEAAVCIGNRVRELLESTIGSQRVGA